jgi:proteasome alpha subunit
MEPDRQAYDRGSTIFSPDGRLYQVEYAREAVTNGSPTVGLRTREGVVFAAASPTRSPLIEPDSIEKLHDVDGRWLVDYGREYAQRDRLRYGEPPGVEPVVTALADRVQEATQAAGTRPFGVSLLVGGVDEDGPGLYRLGPSGAPTEWAATAIGRNSDAARSHLEDEYEAALDAGTGTRLALEALAENSRETVTAAGVDVATLDSGGFDLFDRDRRERLLDEAGLRQGS